MSLCVKVGCLFWVLHMVFGLCGGSLVWGQSCVGSVLCGCWLSCGVGGVVCGVGCYVVSLCSCVVMVFVWCFRDLWAIAL